MSTHEDRIHDQFTRQAAPFSTSPSIRDGRMLDLIIAAAEATPADTVLDVACGPGLVACAFARTVRRVTGLDVVPAMIVRAGEVAAEQGLTNVTLERGDVLRLPHADAAFSIVVSRFAFHHLQDPAAALAEMRRVCRPGGRVVVADVIVSPDPARAAAFHRMEILRDPSHVRALSQAELAALFVASGLGEPRATPWSYEVDVDAMLARSFPAPGDEATIRGMFAASIADDTMGLGTRWAEGKLRFTTRTVILAATRRA